MRVRTANGTFSAGSLAQQRFGRLVAISRLRSNRKIWRCRCDCGRIALVRHSHLTHGNIKSCGCFRREVCSQVGKLDLGKGNTKHGLSRVIEHQRYQAARIRCEGRGKRNRRNYRDRGIKFLFTSFEQFLKDIGPIPHPRLTLDRINNDGNYEPGNVRWATYSQQNSNRRRSA